LCDVSWRVVRGYVADRKPQIRAEAGKGPEAEVDFGGVVINLRGYDFPALYTTSHFQLQDELRPVMSVHWTGFPMQ